MSIIGNDLVPNMTAVLDKAFKANTLEQTEYNKGFYEGAREMLKAFADVLGDHRQECVLVHNGLWWDLVFRPRENKEAH